jgi:hypothetical protein
MAAGRTGRKGDGGKGGDKAADGVASGVGELYALPPGEFMAARKRLAAGLRKAGRGAAAARVEELAKPSASVWAVNQLLQKEGERVAALLAAGERARATQQQVLSGKRGADTLQQSAREVRELVEQLARRAAELAGAAGTRVGVLTGERIAADLEAMALDPAGAAAVAGGWLERDLERPGLNVLAGARLPAGARRGREAGAAAATAPGRVGGRVFPGRPAVGKVMPGKAAEREKAAQREEAEREKLARQEEAERRAEKVRESRAAAVRERIAEADRAVRRAGAEVEGARREVKETLAAEAEASRQAREARAVVAQARKRAAEAERELARARKELASAWRTKAP